MDVESQDQNLQRVMEQIVVFLVDVTGLQTGRRLCFRVRSRGGKPCIAGTGSMSGWSPGDWSEGFAGGPVPAHGSSQETEFEVACRRGAGSRLSLKVTCWRWGGVGTSYTAGAGSAFRRVWERGKLVEKAKTVSRSVIQQRTVEQIVDLPVAKVVELVPQMVVQLVDVPKTLSRDRIRQRADERIDDIPVPKVLEARVEERILDCMVEQIAEVLVQQMEERVSERIVEQIADFSMPRKGEHLVEVLQTMPRVKIQQRVDEQVVDVPVPKGNSEELVEVFRVFSKERISEGTVEKNSELPVPHTGEHLVEVPKAVFRDGIWQRVDEQIDDRSFRKGVEDFVEVCTVFTGEHLGADRGTDRRCAQKFA